jgi:hypothetical protein
MARDRMPSAGIALRRPPLKGERTVELYQTGTAKKSQIALPTSCASPVARTVDFEAATTRLLAGRFNRKHSGDTLVKRLDRRECRSWVKSAVSIVGLPLPVYPYKQTCSESFGMSQKCQQETHAPQQTALVRAQSLLPATLAATMAARRRVGLIRAFPQDGCLRGGAPYPPA